MKMAGRLQDKVALITGVGSVGEGWGNGKATAVLFARQGAKVYGVDINIAAGEQTRDIILNEGGKCVVRRADVSKAADVQAMVDECLAIFGRIDILVNNVGIVVAGGPVEQTEEIWDHVVNVNLKSMFLTCKHVLPHMEKQGKGTIVNVSSIAGIRWTGVPYVSYSSTKAAILGFSRSVALQYAARNIRCNTVLPGLMDTPMFVEPLKEAYAGGDIAKMKDLRNRQCPMGKMGDAWDVAYAVLFLASDEAKYITGAELVVDGGITCKFA
jgi:NAD(P)-dependent dehydrogenase (short-subunit alcohol dehydrogenase family)